MVTEQGRASSEPYQAVATLDLEVLASWPPSLSSSNPRGPPHLHILSSLKGHPHPCQQSQPESSPLVCKPGTHGKLPRAVLERQERKGGRRWVVRAGSPHLLPIPVPGIPAERQSAPRPEGKAGSRRRLPCSDLTASLPQAAGPQGPFCMGSGFQGSGWAWVLSPLLMGTQKLGTSESPGNGVALVSRGQSRKGLGRGRQGPRGLCQQGLRGQPTLPPACRPTGTMSFPPPELICVQKKGLLEAGPALA